MGIINSTRLGFLGHDQWNFMSFVLWLLQFCHGVPFLHAVHVENQTIWFV